MAVVKMQDVAAAAGVSVSTVSRVLRGGEMLQLYDADTVERIRAVAAEMGYVPNAMARKLRSGRTGQIGIINASATAHWSGPVALTLDGAFFVGLSLAAAEQHLTSVNIFPFTEPDELLDRSRYLDGSIDGLIVRCYDVHGVEKDLIDLLAPSHLPVVAVMRQVVPASVGFADGDQRGIGYLAVQHLLQLGHRRIAFVAGEPEHVADSLAGEPGSEPALRYHGYCEALLEAGVSPRREWLVCGASGLLALLQGQDPVTAACMVTASLAQDAAAVLPAAGFSIPTNVSLIGLDDVFSAGLVVGGLTAVHFPVQEIAEQSVRNLAAMIAGAPGDACRTLVPVQLVVRNSTALPSH